ncbi:glycosyltransferase [Paenibacillus sabinae]|uniref:Glycosyltransferase n=1 Tax=Paenibacillus sabinae T27 TaxID=1268072 RepID=X4ZG77_9BACL|nr:glycosyltransferase [Paenibacillus sabinae]AHV96402.1 glycosyltransferase [Paenibacillus sabinae T27]
MKKKAEDRSKRRPVKKRAYTQKPIVQYVVNANPPKQVVWFNKDESNYSMQPRYSESDLRILMVLDQFNIGGTETHVLTCVRELLRNGVHVVVAGKRGEMCDAFAALGCPVYEINFVTNEHIINEADEQKIISQLKQIINTEGITAVHIHQLPSGTFAAKAADQLCIPRLWTLHMLLPYTIDEFELIKSSAAVVCVSPSIMKQLPVKDMSVQLIPNGIDTVQFNYRSLIQSDLRDELGIPKGAPVIMYAGRLSWEKADICRDIIEACRQLRAESYPDLNLLVTGEGRHSEGIKSLVDVIHKETKGNFIHLLGNTLNMSSYYSICDVFLGTGRAALEALACCRPVVAVGVKGFVGLVNPGNYRSAWETWFGDHHADEAWSVEKLKTDINRVLDMPVQEKMETGWVNRNLIKEQFNFTRTTDMLMNVYANILKNRYASYEVE